MLFANLIENPEETALIPFVLGTILSQGLDVVELGILARLLSDISDVVATYTILKAARDLEITTKALKDKDTMVETALDQTQVLIKELQQQNQHLQAQILILRENLLHT